MSPPIYRPTGQHPLLVERVTRKNLKAVRAKCCGRWIRSEILAMCQGGTGRCYHCGAPHGLKHKDFLRKQLKPTIRCPVCHGVGFTAFAEHYPCRHNYDD